MADSEKVDSKGTNQAKLSKDQKSLSKIFSALDSVLAIYRGASSRCSFQKIQKAVSRVCAQQLRVAHLRKIETIMPGAYEFERSKFTRDYWIKLPDDVRSQLGKFFAKSPGLELAKVSSSRHVLENRHCEFESRLRNHTPRKMSNLAQPRNKIHKSMKSNFPVPPSKRIRTCDSISSTADQVAGPGQPEQHHPDPHKLLMGVTSPSCCHSATPGIDAPSRSTSGIAHDPAGDNEPGPAPVPAGLKGLPSSLLEKIRRKQAAKKLSRRAATANKAFDRLCALPQLCSMVHSYVVTHRKTAEFLGVLVDQLVKSRWYKGVAVSKKTMERRVVLLCDTCPDWCHIRRADKSVKGSRCQPIFRIKSSGSFEQSRDKLRAMIQVQKRLLAK